MHGEKWHRIRVFCKGRNMSITVNLYYTGQNGSARQFAEEMVSAGVVERVRAEEGNLRY